MHQDEQMKLDQKSQTVRNTGNVLLYDFDSVTGTVSNGITLISNSNPYGVEFSSKTKNYMWQKIILIQEEIKLWKVS
jgi:hypothetical protein